MANWAIWETLTDIAAESLAGLLGWSGPSAVAALRQRLRGRARDLDNLEAALDPRGLERILRSSELANAFRQSFANRLDRSGVSRTSDIRKLFRTQIAILLGQSEDDVASIAAAMIERVEAICFDALAAAVERGELSTNELLSDGRHARVSAELANLHRLIELHRRPETVMTAAAVHRFEDQIRFLTPDRFAIVRTAELSGARKFAIDDLFVEPVLATYPRQSDTPSRPLTLGEFRQTLHRTVLVGQPGSGKSTLAAKLARDLCLHSHERLVARRNLTPVVVRLRDFMQSRLHQGCSLLQYLSIATETAFGIAPPEGAFEYLLLHGRLLVVFDGLDEVANLTQRRQATREIEQFGDAYPIAPILVTSRVIGYGRAALDDQKFAAVRLLPMGDNEIGDFVARFMALPAASRAVREFLRESAPARELRTNPLTLGLLCGRHIPGRGVPRDRATLLEQCSSLDPIPEASRFIRPALEHLAWLLSSNPGPQQDFTGKQLLNVTRTFLAGVMRQPQSRARTIARELVKFWTGKGALFLPAGQTRDGQRLFEFAHRTFVEYFAARAICTVHASAVELTGFLRPIVEQEESELVAQMAVQIRNSEHGDAGEVLAGLMDQPRGEATAFARLAFCARALETVYPARDVTLAVAAQAYRMAISCSHENSAAAAESGDRDGADLIGPLLGAHPKNHMDIALTLATEIERSVERGAAAEKCIALELGLYPRLAWIAAGRSRVSWIEELWGGFGRQTAERHRSHLVELAGEDLEVALEGYRHHVVTFVRIMSAHGPRALFEKTRFRHSHMLRASLAETLWAALADPAESPRAIADLAAIGRSVVNSPSPWLPFLVARTGRHLTRFSIAASDPSLAAADALRGDAAFGLFSILAVLREANLLQVDHDLFDMGTLVSARGQGAASQGFAPLLDQFKFTQSQRSLMVEWMGRRRSMVGRQANGAGSLSERVAAWRATNAMPSQRPQ